MTSAAHRPPGLPYHYASNTICWSFHRRRSRSHPFAIALARSQCRDSFPHRLALRGQRHLWCKYLRLEPER